jgi:hypothetical protein
VSTSFSCMYIDVLKKHCRGPEHGYIGCGDMPVIVRLQSHIDMHQVDVYRSGMPWMSVIFFTIER